LSAELGQAMASNEAAAAALAVKNGELERSRRRLSELEASAAARERAPDGDLALRQAIAQLAADVLRLGGAAAESRPLEASADRIMRREPQAPFSQGPAKGEGLAPAKLRELQSMVPGH
jgi:hypothetical protein